MWGGGGDISRCPVDPPPLSLVPAVMQLPTWFRPFATPRSTVWWLTGLGLVLVLPSLFVRDIPGADLCNSYLRMARAWAEGRGEAAHYHMIPPLFVQLAGAVVRLGVETGLASRVVSLLAFLLGTPLVYLLLHRFYGHRTAAWATLLYVVSDRMLRYSIHGGPDSLKTTLVVALALLLVSYLERRRWWWLAAAGVAVGLMTLARSESLAFAGFLVLVPLWAVWRGRHQPAGQRVTGGAAGLGMLIALVAMGLVLLPRIQWQSRETGLWLTDSRQLLALKPLGLVAPDTLRAFASDYAELPGAERLPGERGVGKLVAGVVGGFAFPLWLALLGLWLRGRRPNRWAPEEWLLLAIVVLNVASFFVPSGYIIPRYVATVQPLLLGWAALAICAGLDLLRSRVPPAYWSWGYAVLGIALAASVWNGMSGIRPSLNAHKNAVRRLPREVATWIGQHRAELSGSKPRFSTHQRYHDGLQPLLMAARPQDAFLARADYIQVSSRYRLTPEAMLALCRKERPDLLLVEKELRLICPGLEQMLATSPEFALAKQWQLDDYTLLLYRYRGRAASRPPAAEGP